MSDKKSRKEIIEYYKETIPDLEIESKYYELTSKIYNNQINIKLMKLKLAELNGKLNSVDDEKKRSNSCN